MEKTGFLQACRLPQSRLARDIVSFFLWRDIPFLALLHLPSVGKSESFASHKAFLCKEAQGRSLSIVKRNLTNTGREKPLNDKVEASKNLYLKREG